MRVEAVLPRRALDDRADIGDIIRQRDAIETVIRAAAFGRGGAGRAQAMNGVDRFIGRSGADGQRGKKPKNQTTHRQLTCKG
ncbi:hypothetical protein D3C76_1521320 [compost metagenome]